MESVVKNCGQTVHDEVANKQTMEELKELLKVGALQSHKRVGEGIVSTAFPSVSWSPVTQTALGIAVDVKRMYMFSVLTTLRPRGR